MALIETSDRFIEVDFFADHLHIYQKSDAVIRTRVLERLNYYRMLTVSDQAVIQHVRGRYFQLMERVTIDELLASSKNENGPVETNRTGRHRHN